jgi:ABC-type nitrate/sulfonate/bicarbonate transport system substrate-binding protein
MATLAATDRLIAEQPKKIAGAVRAIAAAQLALQKDVQLAENVAAKLFPQDSSHVVELVRRDLPFYRSDLTHSFIESMNHFLHAGSTSSMRMSPNNSASTGTRVLGDDASSRLVSIA